MTVLPDYSSKEVPPKPNVFIFCYSKQHFIGKFSSLTLNFKTGNWKPVTFSVFFGLGLFLIGLDQTGQVCVMCFATSSKGSVSRSSVPVQGDWIAASSGWRSSGAGSTQSASLLFKCLIQAPSEKHILEKYISCRQVLQFPAVMYEKGLL